MHQLRYRVVVADDDASIRALVRALLDGEPDLELVGEAADGLAAVTACAHLRPDVVVMDVTMPRLDGAAATARLVEVSPGTRVLAFTGHVDGGAVSRMVLAGAVGYAVKAGDPMDLVASIRAAAQGRAAMDPAALPALFSSFVDLAREEHRRRIETERLAAQLDRAFADVTRGLVAALHSRDGYTGDHDDRVGDAAVAVGRRLGVDGSELRDLHYGAVFHDIGKIGVPDRILHKRSGLDDEEWAVIRQHTIYGEQILRPIRFLSGAATIVRHSHERWDGTGYPDRLAADEIPLASRIVCACDAFDAMTSDRSYQRGRTTEQGVELLHASAGDHFDPDVVDALCDAIEHDEIQPAVLPALAGVSASVGADRD